MSLSSSSLIASGGWHTSSKEGKSHKGKRPIVKPKELRLWCHVEIKETDFIVHILYIHYIVQIMFIFGHELVGYFILKPQRSFLFCIYDLREDLITSGLLLFGRRSWFHVSIDGISVSGGCTKNKCWIKHSTFLFQLPTRPAAGHFHKVFPLCNGRFCSTLVQDDLVVRPKTKTKAKLAFLSVHL